MTSMLAYPLTKALPIYVFQEHVTRMGLLGASTLILVGVFPFHVFCKESSCFSLLHVHFDICHYLMILYHFDYMNDKMRFFFLLNQCSCHCNASRLVAPDYVQFMHPLSVLIVHDWL